MFPLAYSYRSLSTSHHSLFAQFFCSKYLSISVISAPSDTTTTTLALFGSRTSPDHPTRLKCRRQKCGGRNRWTSPFSDLMSGIEEEVPGEGVRGMPRDLRAGIRERVASAASRDERR